MVDNVIGGDSRKTDDYDPFAIAIIKERDELYGIEFPQKKIEEMKLKIFQEISHSVISILNKTISHHHHSKRSRKKNHNIHNKS